MYIDDLTRLRHMRDAAQDALAIALGRERGELETDRMLALSLVKSIEIIGEAASHVTAEYRDAHGLFRGRSSSACGTG